MATRVSDSRQRIVLSIEVDQGATGTTDSLKCRVKTVCVAGDAEALLLQEITYDIVGSVLLIGELWMRPNLTTPVSSC